MNVQAFLDAGAVIQIHIISAILALCIGLIAFLNQKGTPFHIRLGKTWLGLMIVGSLTGLFIHEIRTWGLFSPIHMFSFVVPISLTLAIYYARKGRIADHKRTMTSVFVGSNLIAGGFAFLPGRLSHDIFLANLEIPAAATGSLMALPLFAGAAVFLITYILFLRHGRGAQKRPHKRP